MKQNIITLIKLILISCTVSTYICDAEIKDDGAQSILLQDNHDSQNDAEEDTDHSDGDSHGHVDANTDSDSDENQGATDISEEIEPPVPTEQSYNIIGLEYVSEDAILKIIDDLREANMLTLNNLIISLHNLKVFESINIDGDTIFVKEYPSVADVQIYVADKLMLDNLVPEQASQKRYILNTCEIKQYQPIHPNKVYLLVENLKRGLSSQMFTGALFTHCKVVKNSSEQNILRIDIDTIQAKKNMNIIFTGNKSFRSDYLKLILPTKTKTFLKFFNFNAVSDDIDTYESKICEAYRRHGFLDIKVNKISAKANKKNKNEVIVRIDLTEGKQYKIRDIIINNLSPIDNKKIESMLNLHSKSPLMQSRIDLFQIRVREHLLANNIQNMHAVYRYEQVADGLVDVIFDIQESQMLSFPNININSQYASHMYILQVLGLKHDLPTLVDDELMSIYIHKLSNYELYGNDITYQLNTDQNHNKDGANITNIDLNINDKVLKGSPGISYGSSGFSADCHLTLSNIGSKRDLIFDTSFKKERGSFNFESMLSKHINLQSADLMKVFIYGSLNQGALGLTSMYKHSAMLGAFNRYPTKSVLDRISSNRKQYIDTSDSNNIDTVPMEHSVRSDEREDDLVKSFKNNKSMWTTRFGVGCEVVKSNKMTINSKFGVCIGISSGTTEDKMTKYEIYDPQKHNSGQYESKTINGKQRLISKLNNKKIRVLQQQDLTRAERALNVQPGQIIERSNSYIYRPDYLADAFNDFIRFESSLALKYLLMEYNDVQAFLSPEINLGIGTEDRSFVHLSCALSMHTTLYNNLALSAMLQYKTSLNKCVLDNISSSMIDGCDIGPVDIINGYYLGGKHGLLAKLNADYNLFRNHVFAVNLAGELGAGALYNSGVKQMRLPDEMIERRGLSPNSLRIANDGAVCPYAMCGFNVKLFAFKLNVMFGMPLKKSNLNQVSLFRIGLGR